jgi:hypothetical protein
MNEDNKTYVYCLLLLHETNGAKHSVSTVSFLTLQSALDYPLEGFFNQEDFGYTSLTDWKVGEELEAYWKELQHEPPRDIVAARHFYFNMPNHYEDGVRYSQIVVRQQLMV